MVRPLESDCFGSIGFGLTSFFCSGRVSDAPRFAVPGCGAGRRRRICAPRALRRSGEQDCRHWRLGRRQYRARCGPLGPRSPTRSGTGRTTPALALVRPFALLPRLHTLLRPATESGRLPRRRAGRSTSTRDFPPREQATRVPRLALPFPRLFIRSTRLVRRVPPYFHSLRRCRTPDRRD